MDHLGTLLALKITLLKNSLSSLRKRSSAELITLLLFLLGAGTGLFFFFHQGFKFFQGQKPFGPILLDETFYLFNFTLFVMILISAAVSSYSSLFKSSEVPFLLTHSVSWSEIYFTKLAEALWFSSWGCLFITIPFMAALGITKGVTLALFPVLCLIFYIPFVCLAAALGTLVSVLTVWLLPTRKKRKAAILLTVLLTGAVFFRTQPELIQEQSSIAGILSGYLPNITFAKHPLLPSTWTAKGLIFLFGETVHHAGSPWEASAFYFSVLFSNLLFFLIPSFSASMGLYPSTYLKAQDHGEIETARRVRFKLPSMAWFDHLKWPSRPAMAFLEKDLKSFGRDASEWSQLIIFFGLLLIYFLNLKNLEFNVLKDFWKNLVFVLNTVGTYIVLSSFSMRFVFPMLSMEGSRAWILGLAPIHFASLLLEKFFLGTVVSVILTMPLVFLSGWMLDISHKQVVFTTCLGFFVCVALTGLSVGLGAKFPNFKSSNPSEIISGIGGSLLLVTHLAYLACLGIFLMLSQKSPGLIFVTTAAASLLIGMIPLKIGVHALRQMEF